MERLNLSLDHGLIAELRRVAKREKSGVAGVARRLILEALAHRRRLERNERISASYRAGADDAEEIQTLHEMQAGQDELLALEGDDE